jgi:hypothetical protein
MKRSDYERTLRMMEHVRLASYEAETKAEEKRLIADYGRMWKAIEPFATGAEKLEDD